MWRGCVQHRSTHEKSSGSFQLRKGSFEDEPERGRTSKSALTWRSSKIRETSEERTSYKLSPIEIQPISFALWSLKVRLMMYEPCNTHTTASHTTSELCVDKHKGVARSHVPTGQCSGSAQSISWSQGPGARQSGHSDQSKRTGERGRDR
jgi:hypothetical protein